jgi:hypothetical protein
VQLRKLVAYDRLLARLMVVGADRWILKGALALHFRLGAHFRATRDLDLGRWDSETAATADLLAVQRLDLGDYFQFVIQRTDKLDALLEGAAVRYHVSVVLVLIATYLSFEAGRLRMALRATFDGRGTHQLPARLPTPPSQWVASYARMATDVGLEPDISVGFDQVRAFLDPILVETIPEDARWDPIQRSWSAWLALDPK